MQRWDWCPWWWRTTTRRWRSTSASSASRSSKTASFPNRTSAGWSSSRPALRARGAKLLLARGANPEQVSRIGNQTGGRVFLFLYTDDFWRDFNGYKSLGIEFVREPSEAPYGTVAVFKDLYGTLWDLVQPR